MSPERRSTGACNSERKLIFWSSRNLFFSFFKKKDFATLTTYFTNNVAEKLPYRSLKIEEFWKSKKTTRQHVKSISQGSLENAVFWLCHHSY